jgi:hypothetical protein
MENEKNNLLLKKYIRTCGDEKCVCHSIYNDKKKIKDAIEKKQIIMCYKLYKKIYMKNKK